MSKKRLEEIERLIAERNKHMGNDNDYSNADQYVHELSDKGHIDWLVDYAKEQAERVKELEQIEHYLYYEECYEDMEWLVEQTERVEELEEQNTGLKQDLKDVLDRLEWVSDV